MCVVLSIESRFATQQDDQHSALHHVARIQLAWRPAVSAQNRAPSRSSRTPHTKLITPLSLSLSLSLTSLIHSVGVGRLLSDGQVLAQDRQCLVSRLPSVLDAALGMVLPVASPARVLGSLRAHVCAFIATNDVATEASSSSSSTTAANCHSAAATITNRRRRNNHLSK